MRQEKKGGIFWLLVILLAATVLAAMCIGRYTLPVGKVIEILFHPGNIEGTEEVVVWNVRFPRTIMAMMVGAGLSCVGVSLQAMFANPLVSSHILGVSYSAGFGAALALELIGRGIWKEAGVYAPEYFDPEPYIQLMDESGNEYKNMEITREQG